MKSSNWLAFASKLLEDAGIGTARLDALVLLEDVLGKDRTHILAHPELKLTKAQQDQLQKLLNRRTQHEPLAYIRGKTEFYGREFIITPDVLEPRPESETMIDLLKTHCAEYGALLIIDVGTGSGALAVTAALELPKSQVFGIDIDPKCLKVAQQNANKHAVDIEFSEANLLESFLDTAPDGPNAILANLPYVPDDHALNEAAMNEPKHAIFGGPDGLDLYRKLFKQLRKGPSFAQDDVFVLTESLPFQHEELVNIASAQKFTQIAEQDFIQVFTNA